MIPQLQLRLAAALIAFAPTLGAQKTTAPPPAASKTGKAQIVGVVVDSLNGRYLRDADVLVEGTGATLETDSLGKFEIDSLAPGTYQVGVFHPLLDTLGITLATKPFHIGPDSSRFVLLAVPSAATIIRGRCPVQPGARDMSAVIGHVNDPETLQPVVQAEVSVAWTDLEVSQESGLRRTSRLVRDSTDRWGAFKICGLPSSLQATLQARRGSTATAEIPISLGEKSSGLLARTLLLSPAESGTKVGNATVSGLVVLEGSPTNAGSRVELVGTDIVTMTNDQGEFTMRNLPSGTQTLMARHLGYGAETVPVDLSSRQQKRVTIKLPKFLAIMDPVLVTARRSAALDKIGFSQRRKSGVGYFIGPERLEYMHPNLLTDILRRVPELRVNYGPEGDVVSSRPGGSGCVQYFLDDVPYVELTPGDINHFVTGGEVVAVEVYDGINAPARYTASAVPRAKPLQNVGLMPGNGTAPAQTSAGGGFACTAIVLWTRFKIRS